MRIFLTKLLFILVGGCIPWCWSLFTTSVLSYNMLEDFFPYTEKQTHTHMPLPNEKLDNPKDSMFYRKLHFYYIYIYKWKQKFINIACNTIVIRNKYIVYWPPVEIQPLPLILFSIHAYHNIKKSCQRSSTFFLTIIRTNKLYAYKLCLVNVVQVIWV